MLVAVLHRGRALGLHSLDSESSQFRLGKELQPFLLEASPAGCTLEHLSSHQFVCVSGRTVVCQPTEPTHFELYALPERLERPGAPRASAKNASFPGAALITFPAPPFAGVVLRVPGGDFLEAGAGDEVRASCTSLRRDREWTLVEVGIPARALAPWPLRAHLRTEQGPFLSTNGGRLHAAAEVPCCSEELLIDLPGVAMLVGGRPEASGCALWDSSTTRLLSEDATTGRVVLVDQSCGAGAESFTVRLSPGSQVSLLHDGPSVEGGRPPHQRPIAAQGEGFVCAPKNGTKPSSFDLLPASGRPVLILTAHGQLLVGAGGAAGARVRGAHRPEIPAAPGSRGCAWLLTHHGDRAYSLRQAQGGAQLCIDDSGAPCLGGGQEVEQQRALFCLDLTWATLPAAAAGAAAAAPEAANFVVPDGSADLAVLGFSIRSLHKIRGHHLYLSALPNGLVTTVYAGGGSLTRFELFTLIDQQAVLESPLKPLERLPKGEGKPASTGMRRCNSQQVLPQQGEGVQARAMSQGLLRLPPIRESSGGGGGRGHSQPRRCQSEPSLSALKGAEASSPPRWLASCAAGPGALGRAGWGVHSPAPLQELACRAVCAVVLEHCCGPPKGQQGLPAGVSISMLDFVSELRLPEELSCRVVDRLSALLDPPEPTKISLLRLAKLDGADGVPAWAGGYVRRGAAAAEEEEEEDVLAAHPAPEAYLCSHCQGASGLLLPLTPQSHPQHHLRMEAAARRRAAAEGPRRAGGLGDLPLMALQLGRQVVVFWGVAKCLAVLAAVRAAARR